MRPYLPVLPSQNRASAVRYFFPVRAVRSSFSRLEANRTAARTSRSGYLAQGPTDCGIAITRNTGTGDALQPLRARVKAVTRLAPFDVTLYVAGPFAMGYTELYNFLVPLRFPSAHDQINNLFYLRRDHVTAHSIPAALSMPHEIKRITKARFAFVLLAATFIMLGTALAAEGDRVDARFEIYGFAGFHVLTNRTSVLEIGERYAIATDLDTRASPVCSSTLRATRRFTE